MLDTLIINGTVIDGSGKAAYHGAVGMKDGKLVMAKGTEPAAQVIDAKNRVVCPGFIDAHSHGDALLGTEDGRMFKTPQGITTELTGQCGGSRAPVTAERAADMKAFFGFRQPLEDVQQWTTFERYLQYAEAQKKSANAKFYVGHRTLRMAAMGLDNRPATAAELENMKSMLRESMEAGAAGLTTGLIYVPGCYAGTDEVVELAKVIAPFNGIYASHMRNESFAVVEAVEETIDIGRRAGVAVDISHHKMAGRDNWGLWKKTLPRIHQAKDAGIPATCDQYPYTRNMTTLRACIPPWYWSEGLGVMTERLKDPGFREKLRAEMEDPATKYDNYYRNPGGWEGVYVASAANTPLAVGKFVADYAAEIGKDPWTAYFDLLVENNCVVGGVYCAMCDEDVCAIIQDPYCVVGTDGCTISWQSKGHPRASACFPHAINYFVKEKKILTLEQMIHKMTGLTAERLMVPNKGLLQDGYDADVLILDYENLKDLATYDDPNRLTEGMDYVFVNGKLVYHDMKFTGVYSGEVIRHKG